jgi:RNA ligase
MIEAGQEGFVLKWPNGYRLKIKSDEYLRLHRLLTNTNNKVIWEILKDGRDFDNMLTNVPDEFMWWVKKKRKEFLDAFSAVETAHQGIFNTLKERPRPQFAAGVADHGRRSEVQPFLPSVLYAMKDDKPYDDIIWKSIKPLTLEVPPVGEHDDAVT